MNLANVHQTKQRAEQDEEGATRRRRNTAQIVASRADAILPMTDEYMQQIVRREKTYEFRRYRISSSVKRIWFYLNAPRSAIAYICEIDPGRTRNPGDPPLPEDGAGNREFNTFHKDWDRYDFAYRVRSVRRLAAPISLKKMKEDYGFKAAPRGLVYVPPSMSEDVSLDGQKLLWCVDDEETAGSKGQAQQTQSGKRRADTPSADEPPAKQNKTATASS
ncbi:hypothetical protein C8Q74DRAFT_1299093 [Fomes fomentarius]|nr:hypothetical protein C8Q74DRAFT_1299093 [Fomes fomentarius]